MRIIGFLLSFIFYSSTLSAEVFKLDYAGMREWLASHGLLEEIEAPLVNGTTQSLTQHIGRQILAVLKDDPDQKLNFQGNDVFHQAFTAFNGVISENSYFQTEPYLAGHFQLLQGIVGKPITRDQKFQLYVAVQIIWAAQASHPESVSQIEDIIRTFQVRPKSILRISGFDGNELLASLEDMGVPLSLNGTELHPIWKAWNLHKYTSLEETPLSIPTLPTYFLNFILNKAEREKSISQSEMKDYIQNRIASLPQTSHLSTEAQSHLAEILIKGRPDNDESFSRAAKRHSYFKNHAEQLPADDSWASLYQHLVASVIERTITPFTSEPRTATPSTSEVPAEVRLLNPLQVEQLLNQIFESGLASNQIENENPHDNHLIKDPRLALLNFLVEWTSRRAAEDVIRVPLTLYYGGIKDRQLSWRLNMTYLFREVLLYEMDKTEVLIAQLERLLPRVTGRARTRTSTVDAFSDDIAKQGIAFILAAWAAGATTKSEVLELAGLEILSRRERQWLEAFSSVIFVGNSLAPDFQNWIYFLPRDQYEDFSADPKTVGEIQWITAHLKARLTRSDIGETNESISKYLVENIDWSKAPEKLKNNFDAQQALISVILEQKWDNERNFGKQANNSRRLNGVSFKIPEPYLREFYSEVIKLLRIKLQTPSIAGREKNAAYIKDHLERYLFRELGPSPANSIRTFLVEIAYDGVLNGEIFFNPRWLDTESPERWAAYLIREGLRLPEAAEIKRLHPDLFNRFMNQAPRLHKTETAYRLLDPTSGCLVSVKTLVGRNLPLLESASK